MTKQKSCFRIYLYLALLQVFLTVTSATENKTTEILENATGAGNNNEGSANKLSPASTTAEGGILASLSTTSAAAVAASEPQLQTIPDFIIKMMKRFGEAKAAEAFQSLDQLPLGLVMKILLVEIDKDLATDIVAMQRYAQTSDKALITMIGRIVAGDKNVPKEIFAMDVKLMKFPWWMRIRDRMLSNLEKYVAAYSLVPVAAKSATNRVSKRLEAPAAGEDGLNSELAAAVAASATESASKVGRLTEAGAAPAPATGNANLESLKISLLNPIQQQQLLGTLQLAKAAADSNAQSQQLLLQAQQAQQVTNINPFSLFG